MEKTKLITEYSIKVEQCAKKIQSITRSIQFARNQKEDEDVIIELSNDRKIEDAKRQAYFQFIKDLEDLK